MYYYLVSLRPPPQLCLPRGPVQRGRVQRNPAKPPAATKRTATAGALASKQYEEECERRKTKDGQTPGGGGGGIEAKHEADLDGSQRRSCRLWRDAADGH
jgi:hypothetical protein